MTEDVMGQLKGYARDNVCFLRGRI